MVPEVKLIRTGDYEEKYVTGYFLSVEQLEKLVTHFETSDPLDDKVMSKRSHILKWLKTIRYE
jgi:hypothetical protein